METTDTITLPVKFADTIRAMKVDDKIDITEKGRAAALNQAKLAFAEASFKTQGHDGKIYLVRTA